MQLGMVISKPPMEMQDAGEAIDLGCGIAGPA
jgi:hypothetical protein